MVNRKNVSPGENTHAYSQKHLPRVQKFMGALFDYVVNVCGMDLDLFYKFAVFTDMFKDLGRGSMKFVGDRTVKEVVREIFELAELEGIEEVDEYEEIMRISNTSLEYLAGSGLAYYQWYTGKSYKKIHDAVSFAALCDIYAEVGKDNTMALVYALDAQMDLYYVETNLKRLRRKLGLSQRRLAKKSGVALRQIQLFEQRRRDINKTQSQTLHALSVALMCKMEDLLEFPKK